VPDVDHNACSDHAVKGITPIMTRAPNVPHIAAMPAQSSQIMITIAFLQLPQIEKHT
jgi:hypothetical protein